MYKKLADIYDYLFCGIDYDSWADYIEEILALYDLKASSIADLACGTGNTSIPLARKGYRVYGIDLAPAMLEKARQKSQAMGKIQFLQQDMRQLQLPGQVDVVTCYHDGLNYILSSGELRDVFTRVNENLRTGGLFIFDLNRVEKLASNMDTDTTFIDEEDMSLIYESSYDKNKDIWEIQLTGFVRQGTLFEKFKEVHQEKAHSQEEALRCLEESGFQLLNIYTAFTFEPPRPEARRLFYVAKKQ